MSNLNITNNDRGQVLIDGCNFKSDVILNPGSVASYKAGTIMARNVSVAKLIPFIKGGTTSEDGIPKTVLVCDVEMDGISDASVRVPNDATVRQDKLIIAADGNADNVDAVVIEQLQDYNIVVDEVTDLAGLDNQ